MTWLWNPLLLVQPPIIATTVGGVVPHAAVTGEPRQRWISEMATLLNAANAWRA